MSGIKDQDKLEEVKTYLKAIKDATDARDSFKEGDEPTSAIVQSWLETSE